MTKNVDYFIELFTRIPEDMRCTDALTDGAKACAVGHCLRAGTGTVRSLGDLFSRYLRTAVPCVNDGMHPDFQQDSPRQRILAALRCIKKMQKKKERAKC